MNDSELTDNNYDAERPQEIAAEQPHVSIPLISALEGSL
jgi:hypothetical protein